MHLVTPGSRFGRSPIRLRHVGMALGFAIGFATGLNAAPENPTVPAASAASAHGPRFFAPMPAHDFGKVPQGETVRFDFKIENRGDAVLEIIDVRPSCGCTTAGEWTHRLQPGEAGVIPIQMETGHFTGPVAKTVTVATNDPGHAETVLEFK